MMHSSWRNLYFTPGLDGVGVICNCSPHDGDSVQYDYLDEIWSQRHPVVVRGLIFRQIRTRRGTVFTPPSALAHQFQVCTRGECCLGVGVLRE